MYAAVENTPADTMFFAKAAAPLLLQDDDSVETKTKQKKVTVKVNKKKVTAKVNKKKVTAKVNKKKVTVNANKKTSSSNRKENDPKPYKKKKGKSRGKPNLKKEKNVPILPFADLKLGSKIEGRVSAFTDFGVFVKINYKLQNKSGRGGYALLHKSQIRDETVEDPKKLFRIGAVIKDLRVIQVNHDRGEVGLSLRKQRDERKNLSEFSVGEEYEGKVARIVNYGAFIDLGAKVNALLHISRISQKKIKNIRNWVNEGDSVKVRIINMDKKEKTMAASMLDMEADEFLNRRSAQLKRMRERSDLKNAKMMENTELKSELEYFEDAVKDLEDALE